MQKGRVLTGLGLFAVGTVAAGLLVKGQVCWLSVVFIVLSIGIRMKNGEWLRRAGPFEISEGSLGQAEGDAEFWRRAAKTNDARAVELQGRLRRADGLIHDLQRSR